MSASLSIERAMNTNISELQKNLTAAWKKVMDESSLIRLIESKKFDQRLYAIYLVETFHYTRHNSRNQALVATRSEIVDIRYMKFCLDHAAEEAGHEYMALHDLKSLGFSVQENELPSPLPETQALIGYLYYISANGNPLQRLGYSFWAENIYEYINNHLKILAQVCQLRPEQLTFFLQHATIDEKHAQEVEKIICEFVKTNDDFQAVQDVLLMSLRLTQLMMDAVAEKYLELASDASTRYSFLQK